MAPAMAEPVPAPDPQALIPPLLACLPTSFASSRPPPALVSLLSPILRQRLHIFTANGTSTHDSWLRLLSWDSSKADTLKDTVENANFEPHPVSGEVEVGDVDPIKYKRFDSETLKAQIPLLDWSLTAIYLWCTGSEEGDAWKLGELIPFDSDLARDPTWSDSVTQAGEAFKKRRPEQTNQTTRMNGGRLSVPGLQGQDEDDYWAQYDSTPGRTPMRKPSYVPTGGGDSEAEYYARYGDVQPAMDNHDPDEQHEGIGETSLDGNAIQNIISKQLNPGLQERDPPPYIDNAAPREEEEDVVHVDHPVPSSPSSKAGSDTIAKLEERAEQYSASEMAIKQHISATMKSMYRLARTAGIPRKEFEDMIARELETMSIFDRDD